MKTFLSAVAVLVLCTTALATDYYVGTAAAGDADGTSAANAYGSLADAFAGTVAAGDTILLLQGTHTIDQQEIAIEGALTIAADPAATADVVIANHDTTGNKIFYAYSSGSDSARLELTLQGLVFKPNLYGDLFSFFSQSSIRRSNPPKYADLAIEDCEFDFSVASGVGAGKEPITGEYRKITISNTEVKSFDDNNSANFLNANHEGEFRMEDSSFTMGTMATGALFDLNGSSSGGTSSVVVDNFTISPGANAAEIGSVLFSDNNCDLSVSGVSFENVDCSSAIFEAKSVWIGADLSFSGITISTPIEGQAVTLVAIDGLYESGISISSIEMSDIDFEVSSDTSSGSILTVSSDFEVADIDISESGYKGAMDSNNAIFAIYGTVSGAFTVDGVEVSAVEFSPFIAPISARAPSATAHVSVFFMSSLVSGTVDIANVELFNFTGTNAFQLENPTSSVVNTTVVGGSFDNLVFTNNITEVSGTHVIEGTTVSESLFFASGTDAVLTVMDLTVENATLTEADGGGLAYVDGNGNFTTVNPIQWSQDLLPLNTSIFLSDNSYLYAELEVYGCGDSSGALPLESEISTFEAPSRRAAGTEKGANVTIVDTREESCDDGGDDSTDDDDDDGTNSESPAASIFTGVATMMAVLVMAM